MFAINIPTELLAQSLRVSLGNTFSCSGFTLLSTVFKTICISVSYSRESQNISSWKRPIKFIRNTQPNSCDWRVFTKSSNGYQEGGSYIQVESCTPARISFLSAGLQLGAHWLPFSLVSSTTHYPTEKELTSLVSCDRTELSNAWSAPAELQGCQCLLLWERGWWGRHSL